MTTTSDNAIIKNLSTATTVSDPGDTKRQQMIEKIQEQDRWKTEQIRQVPIAITNLRLTGHTHDYMELAVETGKATSWTLRKNIKDFKKFVKALDIAFPIEAGLVAGHQRIIPSLNLSRGLFSRKPRVDERVGSFLRDLLKCPPYILQSKLVTEFFVNGSDSLSSISSSETESCSTSFCSTTVKHKLKIKIGEELALVFIPSDSITMQCLIQETCRKFNAKSPHDFTYQDADGDTILVVDDEDLEIAVRLNPIMLKLTAIK